MDSVTSTPSPTPVLVVRTKCESRAASVGFCQETGRLAQLAPAAVLQGPGL